MLTTRPSKRDKVGLLNTDLMMDVMEGDAQVGTLIYDKKVMRATITIGAGAYAVESSSPAAGRAGAQSLSWMLKDSGGTVLACAEQNKASFAVSYGSDAFVLRKKGRPFELCRVGSDQPLGTAGQEKFFTRAFTMRLPADFDPAFQVYLLALVLTYTLQEMGKLTS